MRYRNVKGKTRTTLLPVSPGDGRLNHDRKTISFFGRVSNWPFVIWVGRVYFLLPVLLAVVMMMMRIIKGSPYLSLLLMGQHDDSVSIQGVSPLFDSFHLTRLMLRCVDSLRIISGESTSP